MATKNPAGLFEVKIDGQHYEFEKWGAREATVTLFQLSKIVGKPLGYAMAAFGKDASKGLLDQQINTDLVALAFETLTSNLDENKALELIEKFSAHTVYCNGAKINFDSHYQDRLDHCFKVVYAALEVQYGNFFAALRGLVGKPHPNPATRT